jgi:hypothetical protein
LAPITRRIRLRTARDARDLLERVLSADDIDAVAVLARAQAPTSSAALGRSIKSAHQVLGAVQRARWDVFATVAELPGEWAAQGRSHPRRCSGSAAA